MQTIYLDNNSTTKPATEVIEAMTDTLGNLWANPSSVHRAGQNVRQKVELAREQVCQLINCQQRELIFTSGGTESSNLALHGSLHAQRNRNVIITDKLEHSATRETAEVLMENGVEVIWLQITPAGVIDINSLEEILQERTSEIAVVSIQWSNNETGVIQPIEEIGKLCIEHGVRFHCDGTQWVGKMPTDVSSLPIDLLTFSAHKFHGPKGIGALYVKRGTRLKADITGGPQERELRGGTENVPGIIGFGVACEIAKSWHATDARESLKHERDRFEQTIIERVEDATVNGFNANRIWNTSNIAFPKLEAEAILMLLSERGVCASAGAACSSGSLDPSPVLLAMGVPEELAHGSVRFSLGRETTSEELDKAIEIISEVIARLRGSIASV